MEDMPSPLVRMALFPDLLVKIWPAERVVEGMMVCRTLRPGLFEAPLVKIRANSIVSDVEAASRFLHRFTGTVELQCGESVENPRGVRGRAKRPPTEQLTLPAHEATPFLIEGVPAEFGVQEADEGPRPLNMGSSVMKLVHHAAMRDGGDGGWRGLGSLALRNVEAPPSLLFDLCRWAIPKLPCITTIDLEGNQLPPNTVTALLGSLTKLPNLSTLSLDNCRVGEAGIVHLCVCLPQLTALTDLNLSRSAFRANSNTDDLAYALSRCSRLASLNLSNNHLGTAQWFQQLASALPNMSSLTRLNLASTSEGFGLVAGSLPCCQHLRHLDLSGNAIRAQGAKDLAEWLKQCVCLETLVLSNNLFGEDGTSILMHGIPGIPTTLKSLFLADAGIGPEGAGLLAKVLPTCEGLEVLDVSYNGLGKDGMTLLAKALPRCPRLRVLRVGHAQCGNDAGVPVAEALPACTRLEELDLSSNGFSALGAWKLAWGLPVTLQSLNLTNNVIGDVGARYFAGALPHCNALRDLNLAGTGVGDEGAVYMAEAVPRCLGLKRLNLSNTVIGAHGARLLVSCLERCVFPPELVLEGILHTC